jgi:hypothetical protein
MIYMFQCKIVASMCQHSSRYMTHDHVRTHTQKKPANEPSNKQRFALQKTKPYFVRRVKTMPSFLLLRRQSESQCPVAAEISCRDDATRARLLDRSL